MAEKAKAEQAAYDAGMTKMVECLTAQLRDVTRAFCLKVWGEAMNASWVSTELKLRAPNKVYYPPALHLSPTLPQPPTNPNSAPLSSSAQPGDAPSSTSSKGKEKKKELPTLVDVTNMEVEEEATEVEQLKRMKKDKGPEKRGTKEKEPTV